MGKRRTFGKIAKQRSGRYQASYMHEGERHYAPHTFERSRDAATWLAGVETEIARGTWVSSKGAQVILGEYAREYLGSPSIGDKWRDTCLRNMRLHLAPILGKSLHEVTPRVVRRWHNEALAGDGGRVSIAQSYRFLRAVMNQAKQDELVGRNPCNIRGAGSDRARERQTASVSELEGLVAAIEERYRAPILVAAWCALRRQELLELSPGDVDTNKGLIHVRQSKTEAGVREVTVPPHILPELRSARQWSDDKWFFTSPRGGQMKAMTLYHAFVRAREATGLAHLTIHDLRHTGNTLAANAGATTKDLMQRLGHATEQAARRYLHTVEGRAEEIAAALSEVARKGTAAPLPHKDA